MMNNKDCKALGIYIHIPFCESKCIYCDFLSFKKNDEEKHKYVEYLIKEIEQFSVVAEAYEVKTIFFGGGTPSSIDSSCIGKIMETIQRKFFVNDKAEITIECNPGTVTREKLKAYRQAGINRISFGLQSANNEELKSLGRIHTYEEFLESYRMTREEGFDNINVDIMSGLLNQNQENYNTTLEKVIKLNPEHISAYSLIIEEGTPLKKKVEELMEQDKNPCISEEAERQMYYDTKEKLQAAGYTRYEISNYAKPGFECRHNLSYWERTDYIGFGLNSASLIENVRFTNVADFEEYYKRIEKHMPGYLEEEMLSIEDCMAEFMFLGLRKMEGVSKLKFQEEFGKSMDDIYGDVNKKYVELGLLEETKDYVRLTDAGIDVSNVVMAEYLLG